MRLPFIPRDLRVLNSDGRILFGTRTIRLFAYGFLSVVLMIYLAQIGLSETQIGLLLTLTLIGDTIISLWITTKADHLGRRRMLIVGSVLMVFAGGLFAITHDFVVLLIAATIGVISPSGNEVGPFLSIEQASLTQIVSNEQRTQIFAWYNLCGSFATALGALVGGSAGSGRTKCGSDTPWKLPGGRNRLCFIGLVLGLSFTRLSSRVEIAHPGPRRFCSPKARRAFRVASIAERWCSSSPPCFPWMLSPAALFCRASSPTGFMCAFDVSPAVLGSIFFGANILAGLSALSAAWVASKIGLIRTMVFTHIPSNILLILVPLMPNLPLAIAMLLLRFSISQMDVPTRQSYTMAVVSPDERSAAAGITGIARTTGASLSPIFTGPLLANALLLNAPFIISGGLKIVYDLLLYRSFRAIKPPEEKGSPAPAQAGPR